MYRARRCLQKGNEQSHQHTTRQQFLNYAFIVFITRLFSCEDSVSYALRVVAVRPAKIYSRHNCRPKSSDFHGSLEQDRFRKY